MHREKLVPELREDDSLTRKMRFCVPESPSAADGMASSSEAVVRVVCAAAFGTRPASNGRHSSAERRARRGLRTQRAIPRTNAGALPSEESGCGGALYARTGRAGTFMAARLGSARLGSARLGSARLGSARLGSARLGSARQLLWACQTWLCQGFSPFGCCCTFFFSCFLKRPGPGLFHCLTGAEAMPVHLRMEAIILQDAGSVM